MYDLPRYPQPIGSTIHETYSSRSSTILQLPTHHADWLHLIQGHHHTLPMVLQTWSRAIHMVSMQCTGALRRQASTSNSSPLTHPAIRKLGRRHLYNKRQSGQEDRLTGDDRSTKHRRVRRRQKGGDEHGEPGQRRELLTGLGRECRRSYLPR